MMNLENNSQQVCKDQLHYLTANKIEINVSTC